VLGRDLDLEMGLNLDPRKGLEKDRQTGRNLVLVLDPEKGLRKDQVLDP